MKDEPLRDGAVFPACCPQCAAHTQPVDAFTPMARMMECRMCGCRAYSAAWVAQAWRLTRQGAHV